MLGGSYLLTKLLLPSLEAAASGGMTGSAPDSGCETTAQGTDYKGEGNDPNGGSMGAARVINVSSGGMYTVSVKGMAADLNSQGVEPYDGSLM